MVLHRLEVSGYINCSSVKATCDITEQVHNCATEKHVNYAIKPQQKKPISQFGVCVYMYFPIPN